MLTGLMILNPKTRSICRNLYNLNRHNHDYELLKVISLAAGYTQNVMEPGNICSDDVLLK